MRTNLHYFSKVNRDIAPSTRFQGSKRKLLFWLEEIFGELNFSSAMDVMCGTASVSYLLKRMGKRVIANDSLRFSYLAGCAFIENSSHTVTRSDLDWILGQNPEVQYHTFIADNFNGYYFTQEENQWLDRTISNINGLSGPNPTATKAKRAIATYALVQACLMKRPFNLFHRRNLYLRTNDVKRTFGNSVTWETPFEHLYVRRVEEANRYVFDNGYKNTALNCDAVKLRNRSVDLVYLDPPYFNVHGDRRQSHYRHNYHFVEGLAQYEKWSELIDASTRLRSLKANGSSEEALFRCDKSKLRASLLEWLGTIVSKWPNAQFVMSYKEPGTPSVSSIKRIFEQSGRRVSIRRSSYQYALSKRNGNPKQNVEVLIVAN